MCERAILLPCIGPASLYKEAEAGTGVGYEAAENI